MIVVAVATSVTVSKTASGAVVFHIAVGTAALGAIALLWLPGLLRLLSLTGGKGAAFGVEASVGGLTMHLTSSSLASQESARDE
jgi:hypothetical protein